MTLNGKILLVFTILLFFPSHSFALERFEIITTAEMEQMLEERQNNSTDFLLVNVLDRMIYNHSSIPGSLHLPLSEFEKFVHRLGTDKERLIVPY